MMEEKEPPVQREALMPLAVGSTWTYDVEKNDTEHEAAWTVTTIREEGGGEYYIVPTIFTSEPKRFADEDSALVMWSDVDEAPVKFYYPGLGVSEYDVEYETRWGDLWYARAELISENTPISVPAGSFTTIVYEVETGYRNRTDNRRSTRYYFAPGVGLIHQKMTESGQGSERWSLTDYELASEPRSDILYEAVPQVELVTGTQALISWQTASPRAGTIQFGPSGQTPTGAVSFVQTVGQQSAILSGLIPGTAYDVVFRFDIGSGVVESEPFAFQTIVQGTQVASDLKTYQQRIVGDLAGENELEGGVRLGVRADSASRAFAANYLFDELASLGLEPRRHTYELSWSRNPKGTNPYAVLPATVDTDEYVVVGAHYDTEVGAPGANDNATGVALILGAVREVLTMPNRTKNILVVFFDQEEIGLVGSWAFSLMLEQEGFNIHSAHTGDQMGWDSDGDRAIEIELPTEMLELLYRAAALETTGAPVYTTRVSSTDHQMFRQRGFQAIGLTEEYVNGDTTPHIDQPTDTYDTVNFDYLEDTTRLVSYAWRLLLSQPHPPVES